MKKIISALIALIMIFSLCACSTPDITTASDITTTPDSSSQVGGVPDKKLVNITDYEALLYARGKGAPVPDVDPTPEYSGPEFIDERQSTYISSTADRTRTVELFGERLILNYKRNLSNTTYTVDYEWYSQLYNGSSLFVFFHPITGDIVEYDRYDPCVDREYSSPVNPYSSEEEYIEYAKDILEEYANVTTEGWLVKVSTFWKNRGNRDYFIQDTEEKEDPELYPTYTITFYKQIDGIECRDKMYVKMSNMGEVSQFNAIANGERYEPFEDVEIDREALEEEVLSSFGYSDRTDRKITELVLHVQGDCLWAMAMVKATFYWGEWGNETPTYAGNSYVVKVAEIK